jgi:hypothetical protein
MTKTQGREFTTWDAIRVGIFKAHALMGPVLVVLFVATDILYLALTMFIGTVIAWWGWWRDYDLKWAPWKEDHDLEDHSDPR